jgi:DNA replication and repair protein RecF
MHLSTIALAQFRNVDWAELCLAEGVTLLTGQNGQGKTTALEAIHLLATGRIMRHGRENDAIQHGKDQARVAGTLSSGATLAVTLTRGRKRVAEQNGMKLPRASDLLGRLPVTSFSAADLDFVAGEPADRRLALDAELSQISAAYLQHLTKYRRALQQRNSLLKQAQERPVEDELFETYEETLAISGNALRREREAWLAEIAPLATEDHAGLGFGEGLALAYERHDEATTPEDWSLTRRKDVSRGSTTLGAHRDDVEITVRETDARLYGSQGQQRTAVIAYKLAVLRALRAHDTQPLLLLDDVFSDLDQGRRARLLETVSELAGQVVLTCTEVSLAGPLAEAATLVYRVDSGTYEATSSP